MFISLFLYLGAFFLGLLVSSFFIFSINFLVPSLIVLIAVFIRRYQAGRKFLLIFTCFLLGFWRTQSILPVDQGLRSYFGQNQVWDFWVCADPEPAWDKQIATLCPLASTFNDLAVSEKVIVNLPLYPRVVYGDAVQLKCRLDKPPVFADFNYAAFLAAKGIGATCAWPTVLHLKKEVAGNRTMLKLYSLKRLALDGMNRALPEPAAGLASALLLGYKKTLYPLEELNFQKAGLSHIVAISGGHISLFLNLLINLGIFLGLSKNKAIWPALLASWLYVLLTGVQASAWRSLLMGGIMIYTWRRGRLSSAWAPLFLAGAVMLWQNPALWQRDLGFQLSFLALSGMIAFNPLFSNLITSYCHRRSRKKYLMPMLNAFSISLSAQLAVWPLLALKSGGISLIAPLTNVLAFFIFGPLVLSLLLALGLQIIFVNLDILYLPAYFLLEYLLRLCRLTASWPWAYLETPNFQAWQAVVYYLIIIIFLLWQGRRRRQQRSVSV